MKIGNLPPSGENCRLGKWYFQIEVLAKPPYMVRVFRPYLFVATVKFTKHADPGVFGSYGEKVGGWRWYVFPIGISIEILR